MSLLLSLVLGRLFFGSPHRQQHWKPTRSCCLPQDGVDETFVYLMYFTNKKVLQNVWNWPDLWAEEEIPRDPILFLVKSRDKNFRLITSRKSRDWKFLIPLGPAGDSLSLKNISCPCKTSLAWMNGMILYYWWDQPKSSVIRSWTCKS